MKVLGWLILMFFPVFVFGQLSCGKPTDIEVDNLGYPELIFAGNDAGVFCLGWDEDVDGLNVFRISEYDSSGHWSTPTTISQGRRNADIMRVQLQVDPSNIIHAVWELNDEDACRSDIFYARRAQNKKWSEPKCLFQDLYEVSFQFYLSETGDLTLLHRKEIFGDGIVANFFRQGKAVRRQIIETIPGYYYLDPLWVGPDEKIWGSWRIRTFGLKDALRFSRYSEGGWMEPEDILLPMQSDDKKINYVIDFTNRPDILYDYESADLFSKNLVIHLNQGKEARQVLCPFSDDIFGYPDKYMDRMGNLCLYWFFEADDCTWINLVIKPYKDNWGKFHRIACSGREYGSLSICSLDDKHFIIVFKEEDEERDRSIVKGATIDIEKDEVGLVQQLSPANGDCCQPEVFFNRNGQGFIAWIAEKENNRVIQVAKLYYSKE